MFPSGGLPDQPLYHREEQEQQQEQRQTEERKADGNCCWRKNGFDILPDWIWYWNASLPAGVEWENIQIDNAVYQVGRTCPPKEVLFISLFHILFSC